jgi:DNA-binding XRE family transcriptional regulator
VTGADLLRVRERMGMTQTQMAHALHVHPQTISEWERGTKRIGLPVVLDMALRWLEYVRGKR